MAKKLPKSFSPPQLRTSPGPVPDQSPQSALRAHTLQSDLGQVTFIPSAAAADRATRFVCGIFFRSLLRIPAPDNAEALAIPANRLRHQRLPAGPDQTGPPTPTESPPPLQGGRSAAKFGGQSPVGLGAGKHLCAMQGREAHSLAAESLKPHLARFLTHCTGL